jgi:hypothetical protein
MHVMKKLFLILLCIAGTWSFSFATNTVDTALVDELLDMIDQELDDIEQAADEELSNAVSLLHEYEITSFDTVETFMPDQSIRRDEAAKMYVNFAKNVQWASTTVETNPLCIFTDLHLWHSDLPDLMIESCNRNLFKGYLGAFMPTDSITNAQAVIVLVRMVDGEKIEPTNDHYATNYMSTAEDLGLLAGLPISSQSSWDLPATRATVAKLLYRAREK